MGFIEKYRSVAEFIYFVSNSFLVVGLFIAISQLKQLRKESDVRISREAKNLTLSLLERKLKEIGSSQDIIYGHDFYNEMPGFEGEINGFCKAKVNVKNNWLIVFESNDAIDFTSVIGNFLNELETLAQYILSGLVDEELSYKLEGELILNYINEYKLYIAVFRKSEEDKLYEHIIELNKIWSQKQAHDKLTNEHEKLASKLKSKIRPKSVGVIGK